MPDVWLPGATIDRGKNAGYRAGRSHMQLAVAHYTVGADSRGIARDGFFHWLVHRDQSREGGCTQYAETDAVTWHAAEWNGYGPGIEYERLVTGPAGPDGLSEAQPLTDNQIVWGNRIVEHLAGWGVPVELFDGPRYGAGAWRGWVNHHDLSSERSDGLTRAEWSMVTAGVALPEPIPDLEDADMRTMSATDTGACYVWGGDDAPTHVRNMDQWNALGTLRLPHHELLQVEIDRIASVYPAAAKFTALRASPPREHGD